MVRRWLLLIVACGLVLRLGLFVASGWRMDYDEAMIGLLSRHVLDGQLMAYIPAQATLGALEPYLLAPLLAILGANAVTVRGLSLLLAAVYILTTAALARLAFNARVGLLAGLLAAVAPPYMLVTGAKIWGSTIETIILGHLLLLAAWQVHQTPRRSLALVGFIAGLMFWAAWLGFYYCVPVALLLILRERRHLARYGGLAGVCFLIGSLPFWIYNLNTGWATLTQILDPADEADWGGVVAHLVNDLLPRLVTGDPGWGRLEPTLPVVIYLAGLGALLVTAWRARRESLRPLTLAGLALTIPAIYLLSGYGQAALNPWGVDATGRYVLMLHTALPIGVAVLADRLRPRWLGAALMAVVVGLNFLGALQLDPVRAFDSPYYDRLPTTLDPLIAYLDEHGIRHVWTDVSIAHVLMFATEERILAADYYDAYLTKGFVRFPQALAAVAQAERTALVVPVYPGQVDPPIEQALNAAGIVYEVSDILPNLRVYIPRKPFDPVDIAPGLGYQY